MRCIFPLDNILCPLERLDNACVHSYDSTTDCLGPSLTTTCLNLLSLPNEIHFSTRQYSLSTRQCLCPLVQLDNACVHSTPYFPLLWTPCINLLSLADEMHFSTRRPSYKSRHKIVHIPNQMHLIKVNHKPHHVIRIRQVTTFITKLTSKTIDYENVPLERVEKARSPLVQVKSIGQPLRS